MTREEFNREIAVGIIDKAFLLFVTYKDEYGKGFINGTADTAFLLDIINMQEYTFIMDAICAVIPFIE